MSDPALADTDRQSYVDRLMDGRRAVAAALRSGDPIAEAAARADVDAAKHALGERGPVWWDDGAPDLGRKLVSNTIYADWFTGDEADEAPPSA